MKIRYKIDSVEDGPKCDFLRRQGVTTGYTVFKLGDTAFVLGDFVCLTHDRDTAEKIANLLTAAQLLKEIVS